MTSAALFAYAVGLAGPMAWLLRRARWVDRAPALGVLAWQVLSISVLVAVVLGAIVMIPPADDAHDHNRHLVAVELCMAAVVLLAVVGTSLGRGVLGYLGHGLAERRRHLSILGLVGRQDDQLGAVVVDHDVAAAYCVPGRRRHVVVTSAAIRTLHEVQLAAVLAHEHAHLRSRHHLMVAAGRVLRSAFPFVPAFRWAYDEVARLVELVADDAAARRYERGAVAGALMALATQPRLDAVPTTALGVGGSGGVVDRVRRLLGPTRPLGRWAVVTWVAAFGALFATPVVTAAPAVSLTSALSHCPFV